MAISDEFDKYEIGFEEGATWADETTIKKFGEWLNTNITHRCDEYGLVINFDSYDAMVKSLKKILFQTKAMEE